MVWTSRTGLLQQRKPLGFVAPGGVEHRLSVLAHAGIVCGVWVQGAGLCQGRGGAYGWGVILRWRRSFSLCLEGRVSGRMLFGLAAPLFTWRGTVPHLSLDPIVLHHLSLGTGGHLSLCCPKPVLRQGKDL